MASCVAATLVSLRPMQRVSLNGLTSKNAAPCTGARRTTKICTARRAVIQAVVAAESSVDVAKMAPLGDRVLVKPKEKEEKTAGGILLTGGSSTPKMDDAMIGTVLAVGEDVDCGVAAGDQILFTKYGSSDMEGPEGELSFVAQKSILAKLT